VVLWTRSPREPGDYDSRIVIRDIASGRSAIGQVRFKVVASKGGDIVLASPIIMIPGRKTMVGRLPSAPTRRGAPPEPAFIEIYPFIPRGHTIVVRNLASGTREILAIVPAKVRTSRPGNPGQIEVGGKLLPQPAGEEIPLDLEVVEAKTAPDGRQFLIIRIPLPELGPGSYELEIEAADAASGAKGSVRTSLVLK